MATKKVKAVVATKPPKAVVATKKVAPPKKVVAPQDGMAGSSNKLPRQALHARGRNRGMGKC